MLFNSVEFLLFFPVACLVYFLIPNHRIRNFFLLCASYYFYMSWNYKYGLLLFFSTATAYLLGLLIGKSHSQGKARGLLVFAALLEFGLLFFFKYITLFTNRFSIVLPVGISFYIFQNFSYVFDVYRKDVDIEYNFFDYALYVSFFPQLVAGPIEQSKTFLRQFKEKHKFDYFHFKRGLLAMLWGYFMKLVIADRAALVVDAVYLSEAPVTGAKYFFATALFLIQLYCDFAGYSAIAMGAGEVMGFSMTDNFLAPYIASNVAEFWRRWHVSLYRWFKDYLYIPLGGGRKGVARKYFNVLFVSTVSGLWHGANMTFVVWGFLNGLYQVFGAIKRKLFGNHAGNVWLLRILQSIGVCFLYGTTLVFFRSRTISQAVEIYRSFLFDFKPASLLDGFLVNGQISAAEWIVFGIAMVLLTAADILKYKEICIRDRIMKCHTAVQWCIYLAGLIAVLLFGIYGMQDGSFIYFVF